MTTIILLLLGVAFLLLAFSAWRWRSDVNPSSTVDGFARVLEAIDPAHAERVQTTRVQQSAGVGSPEPGDTGEHDRA